jgi:peptidoglycan/LPS O-acetylase OafA/YrhL
VVNRGVIDKTMDAYQLPISLACTLLVAVVVLPDQAALSRLLRVSTSRPLVTVGLASYSLFPWHEPPQRLLPRVEPDPGTAAVGSWSTWPC